MQTAELMRKLYKHSTGEKTSNRRTYIEQTCGRAAAPFIAAHVELEDPGLQVFSSNNFFEIQKNSSGKINGCLNLEIINGITDLNAFFCLVNKRLPINGFYIGCLETKNSNRHDADQQPTLMGCLKSVYRYLRAALLFRLKITRSLNTLNNGLKRKLTPTETLGRLVCCGFNIIDHCDIEDLTYFICKKVSKPVPVETDNNGPLIILDRVGLNGQLIKVYKFRTMYPYAEYLQEYVSNDEGLLWDKVKNDYRVTKTGRFLRKYWLDEQPMWINYFRGELKLVGIRPLSRCKLNEYPQTLQERRLKYKPGLIPPYYADLPRTDGDFFESEIRYMDQYDRHPFITDFRYFWRVLLNIMFRGVRSA